MLRNPQDNSADLILRVAIAPSYVTYSKAAVQDVVGFFRSEESVELSRLQAQAAARTDKLRHMAQLQLQALSERSAQQKPRMKLLMTLHAPKVAIPGGPVQGCRLTAGSPIPAPHLQMSSCGCQQATWRARQAEAVAYTEQMEAVICTGPVKVVICTRQKEVGPPAKQRQAELAGSLLDSGHFDLAACQHSGSG